MNLERIKETFTKDKRLTHVRSSIHVNKQQLFALKAREGLLSNIGQYVKTIQEYYTNPYALTIELPFPVTPADTIDVNEVTTNNVSTSKFEIQHQMA